MKVKEETVEGLAAVKGVAALRLDALFREAAEESGNVVRSSAEVNGLRHICEFRRLRAYVATGMPQVRAARVVAEELDAREDEVRRLEGESRDLETRLTARYAADRAEWNPQNSARQAALDDKLLVAIRAPAPFAGALQALLPAAAEIRSWNSRIARHQPSGQTNRSFVENPAQYVQRGTLDELAERAAMLHFKIIRVAPDRWR